MTWLLRAGDVLAAAEVAETFAQRSRGLLGKSGYEGAMVLPRTRSVHTFGMRFAIDVALCDRELTVLRVTTLRPYRMTLPKRGGRSVIEAEAGAFERWGLRVGRPPGAAGMTGRRGPVSRGTGPGADVDPDVLEELESWSGAR